MLRSEMLLRKQVEADMRYIVAFCGGGDNEDVVENLNTDYYLSIRISSFPFHGILEKKLKIRSSSHQSKIKQLYEEVAKNWTSK